MAIDAQQFWQALKARGFSFAAGVPDSTFGPAYNLLLNDSEIQYVSAVREDVALGVASAGFLSGQHGMVVMQNSGIGNVVNPLTSFNLLYKIPVLLIVGWRGYGGHPNDAPEHWIMGDKTVEIFQLLGIPNEVIQDDDWEASLDRLLADMAARSIPGAILIRPGALA